MLLAASRSDCGPMRVVEHPGQPCKARLLWHEVASTTSRQVTLEPGQDLFTTLHHLLDEDGSEGATFSLISGSVSCLALMTGGPGTKTPMTFHGPFGVACPSIVLGGAGIIGFDEACERTSHCHAAFRDAAGRLVGGHLIKGKTIAGPEGVKLELTSMTGAHFARRFDAETGFVIFHPELT